MGHTRLGLLPTTRKWKELVKQIAGPRLTGHVVATAAFYIDAKWVHAHLGVMLRACDRAAAPRFSVIDLRALDPALALDSVGIGHES